MISPNSIHGGGISTPRCGASSRLTWALDAVFVLEDMLCWMRRCLLRLPCSRRCSSRLPRCSLPPVSVALPILGSAGSSCRSCFLGSPRTATATAVAVATIAFSHWDDACCDAPRLPPLGEGCVFETLSEVVFELVLPCLAGTFALSDPGAETELPDHVCVNADGAFVVGTSGSCIDPVCSSSTGCWGKDTKGKAEDVKLVQFFVNRGKGSTTVVRCSSGTVLSEVLHLDDDEKALRGSRFAKVGCTIGEILIGIAQMCKCCDASVVVLVCISTFQGSGSAKFVVLLGVGQPGKMLLV